MYVVDEQEVDNFENDVPLDEKPECKVQEDSNNKDNCKQYSEFGDCKLCNNGYKLMSDTTCKIHEDIFDDDIEKDEDTQDDDKLDPENIIWEKCIEDGNIGWKCINDETVNCYQSVSGDLTCPAWLEIKE